MVPHHEFWPAWAFYAPLVPTLLWLSVRHRHPLAFTAANPGIPCGGGIIGESKFAILAALAGGQNGDALIPPDLPSGSPIAPTALVRAAGDPAVRMAKALEAADHLGWPLILKPDAGQRGFGVRLARTPEDVRAYLAVQTRDLVAQRFHPGPEEVGVLWVRTPGAPGGLAGRVFSVTRKRFQHVVGDGERSLRELVLGHPRLRRQARTFLARLGADAGRVPAPGERVRLNIAGNHCQGTLFEDGADLVTPALERAIDGLAAAFAGPNGRPGGLDFGRFDLRFAREDDLRAGRLDPGCVLELNGTTSESTNIYDPDRSFWWAQRVLRAQWGHLYSLGRARMSAGGATLPLGALLAAMREHYRDRPPLDVAD